MPPVSGCGRFGRVAAALGRSLPHDGPGTGGTGPGDRLDKAGRAFHARRGGYFAGMVRKSASGDLHLERTVWALKDRKWGAVKRSHDSWKVTGNAGIYRGRQ